MTFNYGMEQRMRNVFYYIKREQWKEWMKSYFLSPYGMETRIDTLIIRNLTKMDSLLTIEIGFSVNNYGIISGDYLLFPSPSLIPLQNFVVQLTRLSSLEERKYPIYSVSYIGSAEVVADIHLPDGYSPVLMPSDIEKENSYGYLIYKGNKNLGRLSERIKYSYDRAFIYPEEYESFKNYVHETYQKSKEWIILKEGD